MKHFRTVGILIVIGAIYLLYVSLYGAHDIYSTQGTIEFLQPTTFLSIAGFFLLLQGLAFIFAKPSKALQWAFYIMLSVLVLNLLVGIAFIIGGDFGFVTVVLYFVIGVPLSLLLLLISSILSIQSLFRKHIAR